VCGLGRVPLAVILAHRHGRAGLELDHVQHAPSPKRGLGADAVGEVERPGGADVDELRRQRAIIRGSVDAREEIRVRSLAEPISHYTDAVRAGNLVFLSGCVPVDGDGRLVGGDDVVAQARQVFANLGAVLAASGASFKDVVKVTVYLVDIADRAAVNPVRQEVFGVTRPASTLVEVSALAVPLAKLEVEAVALVP